jgi:hypothetical protein
MKERKKKLNIYFEIYLTAAHITWMLNSETSHGTLKNTLTTVRYLPKFAPLMASPQFTELEDLVEAPLGWEHCSCSQFAGACGIQTGLFSHLC